MQRSTADASTVVVDSNNAAAITADGILLRSVAAGNAAAFNQLVDVYKDRLFAHIRRRVRDSHRAEDLTQETFLRFFRAARGGAYTGEARVTTWLFTIASNCVTDHLRSESRRGTIPLNGQAPTTEAGPADHALNRERQSILKIILDSLPNEQREVIELKLTDGLTFGEIAELLGCPVSTAKSRMAYGLHKIEQALREQQRQEI